MTRVVVKRNNPTLLDVYGHWWVEIDEVESYGWWPAVRPVPVTKAIRGVPGILNGVGGPNGGSAKVDPRHGELADHAFHPVTFGDRSDDQIVAAIRTFAATFDGGWRWSIRPAVNCRSFQADLLTAAGLVVPDGYAHSAGGGCPFLASPRSWHGRLSNHRSKPEAGPTSQFSAGAGRVGGAVKKVLILLLVVLVVLTGIPVLALGMSMECADCPPGVLFMATCLAVLSGAVALAAAALVLAFGRPGRRRVGRGRVVPLLRPPRLA